MKKFIPNNNGKSKKLLKTDQRVMAFVEAYTNPNKKTFNNILQSGLKAGYTQEYSENISVLKPKWWVELQDQLQNRHKMMLEKAERNLINFLDDDNKVIKNKTTLFVSERLGKEYYSVRQELTDKGGRRLFNTNEKINASVPLTELFKVSD
jgi:hypothetical protein